MNAVTETSMAPYEMASPTMLAAQPITPKEKMPEQANWSLVFSHLESRLGGLRIVRYSWWTYWSQLAEYILPRRYRWLVTANLMNKGNPINQSIIDATGTLDMNICAAGLVDGLMPSSRPWFSLNIGLPGVQPDEEAKEWFEDTQERCYTVLAQSNFYDCMAQSAEDEVVFGTAPVIMYEDSEDVIRCYNPCAGEYYLAAGARFSVDTMYREFVFTVSETVEFFQLENCPPQIQELWRTGGGSLENEVVIAHAIEPNFPLSGRGGKQAEVQVVPGGFPYREVYWIKGTKTPNALSMRGFHEKPFAVARWSKVANDAYGRSPGMDALPDIKQLQLETARKLEAIEKQVRPPMGADVEMQNQPSSILPGHITYIPTGGAAGAKKGFWPLYEVTPNLAGMVEDIKEVQGRIGRAFLVDVWMAISQMEGVQPRNDLELVERKAEKLQRLGPVIGLWKTEFAGPLIQRLLRILERKRMLRPLPKSLRGVPLKIDYMDMVTVAQIGAETTSMERTFGVAGKLSEAAKASGVPDPLRIFNLDEGMRVYAEKVKFPERILFTEDEVSQHDKQRAKAAQAQQAAQAAQATVPAVQAAEGLSKIDVGGGQTALQKMIGTGP